MFPLRSGQFFILLILLLLLPGCKNFYKRVRADAYKGEYNVNYFIDSATQDTVRRVLLVRPDSVSGADNLSEKVYEALYLELIRKQYFEVIREKDVDEELVKKIHTRTKDGRLMGSSRGALQELADTLQIDAVLYPEVKAHRAFKPMNFAYKHSLIQSATGALVWTVDDLFDMSNRQIERMADSWYFETHGDTVNPSLGQEMMQLSFDHFLRFSFSHFLQSWDQTGQ